MVDEMRSFDGNGSTAGDEGAVTGQRPARPDLSITTEYFHGAPTASDPVRALPPCSSDGWRKTHFDEATTFMSPKQN